MICKIGFVFFDKYISIVVNVCLNFLRVILDVDLNVDFNEF